MRQPRHHERKLRPKQRLTWDTPYGQFSVMLPRGGKVVVEYPPEFVLQVPQRPMLDLRVEFRECRDV